MAFTARTETYVNSASQTTPYNVTLSVPAGTTNGDIMFTHVCWRDTSAFVIDSVPAGWTLLGSYTTNSDKYALYFRKASSEPANYTWSFSGSTKARLTCSVYTSGDFNIQDENDFQVSNTAYRTSNYSVIAAALSVAKGNSPMVLFVGQYTTSTGSFTKPSNIGSDVWTEDDDTWNTSPDFIVEICSMMRTAEGDTGTVTATSTITNATKHAFMVALNPVKTVLVASSQGDSTAGGDLTVTSPNAFELAASAYIATGGTTATTYQLTAPGGKDTGDFQAGKISDDTNPVPSLDLAADVYTEIEFCIKANDYAVADGIYTFRITDNGAEIDTYTLTPQWTIGAHVISMAGSSQGDSTAGAAISVKRGIAASAQGDSSQVSAIVVDRQLVAASTGDASVTAALGAKRPIASAAQGDGTAAALLSVGKLLASSVQGDSTVAGAFIIDRALVSSSQGDSTAGGTLSIQGVTQSLASAVTGDSSVAAAINIDRQLVAASGGDSSVAAALSVGRALVASSSGASTVTSALSIGAAFSLADSAYIAAGGGTATTAQLTPPSGKTTGDFQAGKISDDTNPLTSIDPASGVYIEVEFCIKAETAAIDDGIYQFRITDNGTPLDTYTLTPTWTVGAHKVQLGASSAGGSSASATTLGGEYAMRAASTGISAASGTLTLTFPIKLYGSVFIAAGGNTATTAQLAAPSGKTTGNFQAGKISDDTNPVPALDLASDTYTEIEWSLEITAAAQAAEVYYFRVTNAGTVLDTYTVTPELTIGSGTVSLAGSSTGTSSAAGAISRTRGLAGSSQGDGTSTARLNATIPLAAAVEGGSVITPAINVLRAFTGSSQGDASILAEIIRTVRMDSSSTGISITGSDIVCLRSIAALAEGAGTVAGVLTGAFGIYATSAGAASVIATLWGLISAEATSTGGSGASATLSAGPITEFGWCSFDGVVFYVG